MVIGKDPRREDNKDYDKYMLVKKRACVLCACPNNEVGDTVGIGRRWTCVLEGRLKGQSQSKLKGKRAETDEN